MRKKVGNITLEVGMTFSIKEKDATYLAQVTDMCNHSFFFKTDTPADNDLARVAPFTVVPFYIKMGKWTDFINAGEEVKPPAYSAFIMYLHKVKGMTPLEIHDKYPQFKKSNCYASCADCKNLPKRLEKAIEQTEKFINKYNFMPYYDKNNER